jgi:hypothetical protein
MKKEPAASAGRTARLADVALGASVAAFGAFVIVASRSYTDLGAAFPRAVGVSMIVLGTILAITGVIGRGAHPPLAPLEGSALRRVLFGAVVALWGVSLPWLGILLASLIGIGGLTLVSNFSRWHARRVLVHILGHTALFLCFYLLLTYGLQVPLPHGRLF